MKFPLNKNHFHFIQVRLPYYLHLRIKFYTQIKIKLTKLRYGIGKLKSYLHFFSIFGDLSLVTNISLFKIKELECLTQHSRDGKMSNKSL